MPLMDASSRSLDPFAVDSLGSSELKVPQLGFGGGTLGDPDEIISERQAEDTVLRAIELGIRFYDTAPWYGLTKSEHRLGHALRQNPRDGYILNTKVGRIFQRPKHPSAFSQSRWKGGLPFELRFDYTAEGFQRSYEDSLARLGVNTVDSLVIHDLDYKFHPDDEGVERRLHELDQGGGFDWLLEKKKTKEIKAIGVGMNQVEMFDRFLDRFDGLDFFLVAMTYTLLDQPTLDGPFSRCEERGISVVVGAVYASGILATGLKGPTRYEYEPAGKDIVEKVGRMETICERYGVPLGAVALQFPLWHPIVKSVIPGANSPQIVETNLEWLQMGIPEDLWKELKHVGLLREDAPTP